MYHRRLSSALRECCIIAETDRDKACDVFLCDDIDLVILDHRGDAFCNELLQFFRYVKPSVPVIVVTSHGSEGLAVTVFRLGARDYLNKPVILYDLKKSIRRALGITHHNGDNCREDQHDGWSSIFRAIRYINQNYTKRIKLSEIAKEAGMSISCFERTFKRETGITFTTYVNRLRISTAIKMLRRKGLSMSEIAFACGFTNQFHFTRTFKKIMNVSPMTYRKSLQRKPLHVTCSRPAKRREVSLQTRLPQT
ncbi:MAG: response regulator transcription factor [Nitrospirae bacterium]|nr:response regulator transcription factor [Nitrospirota bacterium]